MKTCRVIASYTAGVCAQVFIMRIAHQYGCEGPAIEMGLLCCLAHSLCQQSTRLNKKMTKQKLKSERFICVKILRNLSSRLFCLQHHSTYSSGITTTKRVVHPLETKDLTHTHVDTLLTHAHTHTHTRTGAPRSAVIHLSLIPTCQPAPPTVSAPRKVTAFQ